MAVLYCEFCNKETKTFALYDDHWDGPYYCSTWCETRAQDSIKGFGWELEDELNMQHAARNPETKLPKPNLPNADKVSAWKSLQMNKEPIFFGVKRALREILEEFEYTPTKRAPSWKYGLDYFRKERGMPEGAGIKDVRDEIERAAKALFPNAEDGIYTKMLDALSKKVVRESAEKLLLGRSIKEGMEAYEARLEDSILKLEDKAAGKTYVPKHLIQLNRDTTSVLCHSGDELPF